MKKISVIIPYYKNLKYIDETISSVFKQNYKNLEILIIYDDSDKYELKILRDKYKKYKTISIIVNEKNLGAAISRNRGINKAKGYYLAFLDSDDYWKKNKLKKQISFMKNNNLDLSYTSYEILRNKKKFKQNVKKFYKYNELLNKCDLGLSTVIMNFKLFSKGKFPNLKTQEDYALWLRYTRKGAKIMGLNEPLTVWRDVPNSLSSNIIQKLTDSFKVYYKFENKNFFEAIYRVLILCINKLNKIKRNYK